MKNGLLILMVLFTCQAFAGDDPQRAAASNLFKDKCGSCHESPEDSYGVFGPGWLPCAKVEGGVCKDTPAENAAQIETVMKAVRYQAGVKPMPPKKAGQLTADQIAVLQTWADKEKNPAPVVTAERLSPPAPAPVTVCQVASEPPSAEGSPVVPDAEATKIMGNSCAGCHGKMGTINSREQTALIGTAMAGAFGLAAIKGTKWVKENFLGRPAAPPATIELPSTDPSLRQLCAYGFRKLTRDKFKLASRLTLAGTASLSAYILGVSQAARHAHTTGKTFQDGEKLDPAAVAKGDLSLAKYHASIVSHSMPVDVPAFPERLGVIFSVGYPTDEERARLAAWIKQLQETKLEAGCTTFSVPEALSYDAAAKRCNAMGMRIPTTAQLEALVTQQKANLPAGPCIWSSGFSTNTQAPRQAYFPDKGVSEQAAGGSCQSICLR